MKVIKKIIIVVALIITGLVTYTIDSGYYMYKNAMDKIDIQNKVTEIRSDDNYTKISELPKTYIDAVVAVEDHRFYNHNGIDIISIGRAILYDIKEMSFVQGGSTITQQLSKNVYFTQEKKFTRKIAEVFMAFEFEKNYSKDDILELYINTSYYGEGCYNVKDASKHYFGKNPKDMNDYECIMLAGVPNAPSVYAPTVNLKLAKQRQKQVADKMVEYGYLDESKVNEILNH